MPDQLWRVDPPDCFAPLTVRDSKGSRTFNLLNRERRVHAYAWLLQHGDERQMFTHLDGALLVDAWSDVEPRLSPDVRALWQPLVYVSGEAVLDQLLIAGLQANGPKPLGQRARERLIERLATHGLTAEQIRQVLRHRE